MKSFSHILLYFVLPAALLVVFFAVYIHDTIRYVPDFDDVYFLSVYKALGVWQGTAFFYTHVNGRGLGHFLALGGFALFTEHIQYYWILLLPAVLLFAACQAILLNALANRFWVLHLSFFQSVFAGLLSTACMYFFLFEGRFQTWYWMSSVGVHPLSISLMSLGFACLLKPIRIGSRFHILAIVCFTFLGGLDELCVLMSFVLFGCMYLNENAKERPALIKLLWPVCVLLALSFGVNLISSGFGSRMDGQPAFALGQSLKNTVHSALLPILKFHYLPVRLIALTIWLGFVCQLTKSHQIAFVTETRKGFLKRSLAALGLILLSLFIVCYVLCDISPERCMIFPALFFLLYITDTVVRKRRMADLY
jgi:hypothetical protein